jgi:hypothetical protein
MIQISLTSALAFYSALLVLVVFAIWFYTEISTRRSYRVLEKQFLWRCAFCGYIYLDEEAETLSRCPRCRNYSSIEDKQARYVQVRTSRAPERTEPDVDGIPARNTSHRKRPHQRRRGPRRR